jgi:hypothetical protein
MENKYPVRYGTEAYGMRPMTIGDIFLSRLNLLVIMAKAFLKSYPMGQFRKKAIVENAHFVFYEALSRTQSSCPPSLNSKSQLSQQGLDTRDHLFLLRTQLLAVMVTSFVEKESRGAFRKKAMAVNIDLISEYLADGILSGDQGILKVA